MERHFDRFFPASRHATVTGHGRPRLEFSPDLYAAIYAVGDVHGCLAELLALEARISEDGRFIEGPKLIVMLGDYVDRGPTSRQVLGYLLSPPPDGFDRILLCGNHEDLFLQFMGAARGQSRLAAVRWRGDADVLRHRCHPNHRGGRRNGRAGDDDAGRGSGAPSRLAPGVADRGEDRRLRFRPMPALRPGVALDAQKDEDLIWIREPFLARGPETGVTVIHGHTPSSMPSFGPGRIGIDTACYSSGRLTAARVVGNEAVIL